MGVGSGIGIDLVESEYIPKEVNLKQALANQNLTSEEAKMPVMVTDIATGANTMLIKDSANRIYKTGLKIDYVPKLVNFNKERLPGEDIKAIAAGTAHYVVLDKSNNLHCYGKVIGEKAEEEYDGFGVFDGDQLFN